MTIAVEDFLEHHGVKGQKWGVRKALKRLTISKADQVNAHIKEAHKYDRVPKSMPASERTILVKKFKAEHKSAEEELAQVVKNLGGPYKVGYDKVAYHKALTKYVKKRDDISRRASEALTQRVQHSNETEDFLAHFGVKGMQWGVRKTPGVSNRVNRMAAKDAKEHARAKLFFGEGAGTRRKLINTKVDHNRKFVPGYGKAFDMHLSSQNLSQHSVKAVKERHSIDRKDRNKKRAGAIARRLTGEWGTQAAFVALAGSGVAFARSDRGQRFMQRTVSKIKSGQAEVIRRKGANHIQKLINQMG